MIISASRFHLSSLKRLPSFYLAFFATVRTIIWASGFLGGRLLRDDLRTHWTLTAWRDQDSIQHFAGSPIQRRNILLASTWFDVASFVQWEVDAETSLPSWEEAHRHLILYGRHLTWNKTQPVQIQRPTGISLPTPYGPLAERHIVPRASP